MLTKAPRHEQVWEETETVVRHGACAVSERQRSTSQLTLGVWYSCAYSSVSTYMTEVIYLGVGEDKDSKRKCLSENNNNIKNVDAPTCKKWWAHRAGWGAGPDSSTIMNHWPKHMTLNKVAYLIKMYLFKTSLHCHGALIMSVLYLFLQDNKLHGKAMKEGNIIESFLWSREVPLLGTSQGLQTQRRTSSAFLGKSFAFRGHRTLWTCFPMQGIPWWSLMVRSGSLPPHPRPELACLELTVDTGKGLPGGVWFCML